MRRALRPNERAACAINDEPAWVTSGPGQGKWSEAADLLNRARAAAKLDPTPGLKLVALYESRHDSTSAKSLASELAVQFPKDIDVLRVAGRARAAAGDIDGAISSYKRAYQLAPTSAPVLTGLCRLAEACKVAAALSQPYTRSRDVAREDVGNSYTFFARPLVQGSQMLGL